MPDPTKDDLLNEAGKQEIIHRAKSDVVKITYMWMAFLSPVVLGLIALLAVAAANIPSFTDANVRLTNTLATMHPWETVDRPSWSVHEEQNSSGTVNRYLRMSFRASTFLQRILSLGWTIEQSNMMMRVKGPPDVDGKVVHYYSPWVPSGSPALDNEGTFTMLFSTHNLPPAGALVPGAQYQCEIRFVMGTHDLSFYREFIIQTDWFTYAGS